MDSDVHAVLRKLDRIAERRETLRAAVGETAMSADDAIVVLTTAGRHEEAASIAASLVERRLAACVQIIPGMTSVYRWEGVVEQSDEWLMIVKTTARKYPDVEQAIRDEHSYETPEIVRISIDGGYGPYLGWLRESVA